MMGIRGSGLIGAVLLISLALGYVVLYLAKRQDNPFKTLGYVIGIAIICISSVLLIEKGALYAMRLKRMCCLTHQSCHGKNMQGLFPNCHKKTGMQQP